jgi:hypothetical protein
MNPLFLTLLCGISLCHGNEILLNDQVDASISFEIMNNFSYPVVIEYDDGLQGSYMVDATP